MPRLKTYHGRALFNVGLYEYDNSFIYVPLRCGADVLPHAGRGQLSRSLCRRSRPRAASRTPAIAAALGGQVRIVDWQQANSSLVNAVEIERNVMFLILTLIIVVAAFNIISGMIMMVKDKGRDIAILRTMGASRGMILRIFMLSGASIGVVGTLAGFALGVVFTRNIEAIRAIPAGPAARRTCSPPKSISSPASRRRSTPGEVAAVVDHGAGAVVPRDALPVLARRPARSGRGAALRMSACAVPRSGTQHRSVHPDDPGSRDGAGRSNGAPVLELRGVRRVFRQGGVELAVLNGVDLALRPGEIVALVGPSGAGKSTLLHVAGLLERPDGGAVLIERARIAAACPTSERTLLRRRALGFVYQFHHLLPEFSALENVMLPQMIAGVPRRRRPRQGRDAARPRRARARGSTIARRGCRAASSSASRSSARSPTTRRSCWPTSRPAISTTRPASSVMANADRDRPRHRPRRADRDAQSRPRPPPRPHRGAGGRDGSGRLRTASAAPNR